MAGALILLFFNFKSDKKSVYREFYSQRKSEITVVVKDGKCRVNKEEIDLVLRQIYVNRIAIVYIVIGYCVSIWSHGIENKSLSFFLICIMFVILVITACCISTFLPKVKSDDFYCIDDTVPSEGTVFREYY